MRYARSWTIFATTALIASCSASTENPLANGLSAEQQALLIEKSIDEIEATENFTPEDFEARQRKHLEGISKEMRSAALENLQKRLNKNRILEMSQTVELDRETAAVDTRIEGPKRVLALFTVTGDRSFETSNASQTTETRFALPWVITVDDGELVFRHQGIRMRDIR